MLKRFRVTYIISQISESATLFQGFIIWHYFGSYLWFTFHISMLYFIPILYNQINLSVIFWSCSYYQPVTIKQTPVNWGYFYNGHLGRFESFLLCNQNITSSEWWRMLLNFPWLTITEVLIKIRKLCICNVVCKQAHKRLTEFIRRCETSFSFFISHSLFQLTLS
jgi:hypothetical protein